MLIDSSGNKHGIIAITEALNKAKAENLDLVQVSPNNSNPVVCKILNYGKYIFNKKKNNSATKGKTKKQSLKEIVDHGFSIKYFRNHSDLCLAGEDKSFIKKFMTKSGQSIFKPALAEEIFSKEDYVK